MVLRSARLEDIGALPARNWFASARSAARDTASSVVCARSREVRSDRRGRRCLGPGPKDRYPLAGLIQLARRDEKPCERTVVEGDEEFGLGRPQASTNIVMVSMWVCSSAGSTFSRAIDNIEDTHGQLGGGNEVNESKPCCSSASPIRRRSS